MTTSSLSSLAEWLAYLEALHPSEIELGLERVRRVALRLGLGPRAKIITVAGTNGKGSCVATLEALCLAAGRRVGTYTSPHFLRYNERVRVNGAEASDEALVRAFEKIEVARGDTSLTYFEFGTLAAFLVFAETDLDVWVLEVGLGGRLDAVNILDADVAVLTSVDLDHQAWLGNDRESIGREKAGIFRAGKPAICVDVDPPHTVLSAAGELLLRGRDLSWRSSTSGWEWRGVDVRRQPKVVPGLPAPALPEASVAAALQAFYLLDLELSSAQIGAVLESLRLTGRRQRLRYRGRELILDVAHNPAAAAYLARHLKTEEGGFIAVFGVMADKDFHGIFSALADSVDYWCCAGLPQVGRAASSGLLDQCRMDLNLSGEECDTVARALERAVALSRNEDRILVLGSFYTVAEVLERACAES